MGDPALVHVGNTSFQSPWKVHNVPPSSEAPRIRIASQRLMAIEQTVATEQATGRRVPASIERALIALRLLDYHEPIELSAQRVISLPDFPSPAEFETLDTSEQRKK